MSSVPTSLLGLLTFFVAFQLVALGFTAWFLYLWYVRTRQKCPKGGKHWETHDGYSCCKCGRKL